MGAASVVATPAATEAQQRGGRGAAPPVPTPAQLATGTGGAAPPPAPIQFAENDRVGNAAAGPSCPSDPGAWDKRPQCPPGARGEAGL